MGRAAVAGLAIAVAFSAAGSALGQTAGDGEGIPSAVDRERILLVLPFDNRTGQPGPESIREERPTCLRAVFARRALSR